MKTDEYLIRALLPGGPKEYDGLRTMLQKFERHYQGTSAALYEAARDLAIMKGLLIIPLVLAMLSTLVLLDFGCSIIWLGPQYSSRVTVALLGAVAVLLIKWSAGRPINFKRHIMTKKLLEAIRRLECEIGGSVEMPFVDLKKLAESKLVLLAKGALIAELKAQQSRTPQWVKAHADQQEIFSNLHAACYHLGLVSNNHKEFFDAAQKLLDEDGQLVGP